LGDWAIGRLEIFKASNSSIFGSSRYKSPNRLIA
jgi:hypothetical protein